MLPAEALTYDPLPGFSSEDFAGNKKPVPHQFSKTPVKICLLVNYLTPGLGFGVMICISAVFTGLEKLTDLPWPPPQA